MIGRNKHARSITVEGLVLRGCWDQDWEIELTKVVTTDRLKYVIKPDRLGRRIADYIGENVLVEGVVESDDIRGRVLRVSTFELIESGCVDAFELLDDVKLEDEERISTMGFITPRLLKP